MIQGTYSMHTGLTASTSTVDGFKSIQRYEGANNPRVQQLPPASLCSAQRLHNYNFDRQQLEVNGLASPHPTPRRATSEEC